MIEVMPVDPFVAAPSTDAAGPMPDPTFFTFLSDLFNGISEGGKIIIALVVLVLALLFFFGRAGKKKLDAIVDASIEAAREAREAKTEAKAAKFGINNNHDTNVRDDIDENHAMIVKMLGSLNEALISVRDDVGGMRSEIRDVRRISGDDRRRVERLDERFTKYLDGVE